MYEMDNEYNIHKEYECISDEINNLDKRDIIKMAQEKDESFNIKNEVIDKGEELDVDFIRSILQREKENDDDDIDYDKFFEDITDIKVDRNNDISSDDQDFDLEMNIAESDSDYSIESR